MTPPRRAARAAGRITLTSIPGVRVGHATDTRGLTGCTVILHPRGFTAGCDVGGGASGTREIETCRPGHVAPRCHALLFAGGSAFGLAAADGVMAFLERRGIGHTTRAARVPIVPAAILYDLAIGRSTARPDARMGQAACRAATSRPVRSGNVGAGTGATVGKCLGMERAMRGGLGNAGLRLPAARGGATVAALAVVNAFGDVRSPATDGILAGARGATRARPFADSARLLLERPPRRAPRVTGTTLVAVVTDARLDRADAGVIARRSQDALARVISPCHTRWDGDIVFVLSAGARRADDDQIAAAACRAVEEAVVDAVRSATTAAGLPACGDVRS